MKSGVSEMEGGGGGGGGKRGNRCGTFDLSALPQDCIAAVLSFTSPRDACRLSRVSTTFKSASESDAVWESFLPLEYQALIPSSLCFSSKKELYLSICDTLFLIDGGRKSLFLERGSGKTCYMLSARDLLIVWGDTPAFWRWISKPESGRISIPESRWISIPEPRRISRWISVREPRWISIPESRFEEVAMLINVCWLEIRGKINISMLSPRTHYNAYLVFKLTTRANGFDFQPVEVSVGLVGTKGCKRTVYLGVERGPSASDDQCPKARGDGWVEIELGEFFNDGYIDGILEMSVLEVKGDGRKGGCWKSGIVIEGIEIRPNLCL